LVVVVRRGGELTCQLLPEKEPTKPLQLQNHLRTIKQQETIDDWAWELQRIVRRMILMKRNQSIKNYQFLSDFKEN
jgi:hypothetical protein